MTVRKPSYRFHKARRCAVVTIAGKDHYLGAYDSPESWEKYHRLVAEWFGVPHEKWWCLRSIERRKSLPYNNFQ